MFAVAMSKLISVEGAGAERLTVKVAIVVPLLPSVTVTSVIERLGGAPAMHVLTGDAVLRGKGPATRKSAAF